MKFIQTFPGQVVGGLLLSATLAAYPLATFASREVIVATFAGAVLSTANVVAGYLTIEFSFNKSHTTFLKAILGGMALRMIVMLAIFFVLIRVFDFHAFALSVSLLGFYVLFMVLEVLFIQKKSQGRSDGEFQS